MSDLHPLEEAKALIVKGAMGEAADLIGKFLDHDDFFHAEALFMLGGTFIEMGRIGAGAVLTSAAIDAKAARGEPFPEALRNLGAAYKAKHDNETALKIWLDALKYERDPVERANVMSNISGIYVNNATPDEAVRWCDKALEEDPHCWRAQTNRGMAYLEQGRWRDGWEGFRYTYLTNDRQARRYKGLPEWDGSPNRKVIVFGDQGVGDEIYFASCLNDMIAYSDKVVFDCHPRLTELFKRSFPKAEVHGTRKHLSELEWLPACDADSVIGLADLPRFFRNEGEWDGKPYLEAHWGCHGAARGGNLRIGISWAGGTNQTYQALRSFPLDEYLPIFKSRPDAQFYSLQYTPNATREVCQLEEKYGVRVAHFPGWVECHDYDKTASFVKTLDLVITVCTTIHHVAGALGVPCWTLVPAKPSWRYLCKGETLPWYGSVKLFRQEKDGDWRQPIDRIVQELKAC